MDNDTTSATRHEIMASVKSKNTKPELVVRKYLWAHGFRYRLYSKNLPGHPDLVLRKYRTCIFVNGCFWHGHKDCRHSRIPKTNSEYWEKKINRNRERDRKVQDQLTQLRWHCITIWECALEKNKRKKTLESLIVTLNKNLLLEQAVVNAKSNLKKIL